MSIQQTWNEYRRHRDGDHFTDSVSLLFVPTASGARGYDAVRQYLAAAYDSAKISVKEQIFHRTIGHDSIVEESEATINFITGEGNWIIPGIDSRHTIDATVVIPMVTIASFELQRIASIRIYWDQACVLKQLKLITDKNSWPIVGERQIDGVRDITNAYLNQFGRSDLAAGVSQQIELGHQNVHTSSRVNQPGGTGGKSNVFGDTHEEQIEPARRNIHTSSRVNQPGGTGGKSSVFGDTHEEPANRRFNQNKNTSQFSIGGDADSEYKAPQTQRRMNYNAGRSQFEIGGDQDGQAAGSITGSYKKHFGRDQSSVTFGNEDTSTNQNQKQAADQQEQDQQRIKPSSRVLKPPGGGDSQITFG
ncbi:6660_t:CDS:2 [Ambispora gerdemannii]|uniref:6660_t:CDS:1 n=1 Tax=Ambispora gerdemannii TaxID=144530 RepID=A0A9N8VA45_9GLOM|nr:6660_t:CDS:2 [Ambispora gerdemannii]